jgi:hypothetical protein
MKKLGRPLPPVEEITPPDKAEIDAIVALWNANCPPFYAGLMEAQLTTDENPKSRFLYDKRTLKYTHRKTGRILDQKEISTAFLAFKNKMAGK